MFTGERLQKMIDDMLWRVGNREEELLKAVINYEFNPTEVNKREVERKAEWLAEGKNAVEKLTAMRDAREPKAAVVPAELQHQFVRFLT